MKLTVNVVEARNLPAMDLNGFSDPYVRLQLGRYKFRTKVVKKNLNPVWKEEFRFWVEDLSEELTLQIFDEDKYFQDDFIGLVKMPVSKVFDAENRSLGTTAWYPLQSKNKKSKNKDNGEILLTISFSTNNFPGDEPVTHHSFVSNHVHSPTDTSSLSNESISLSSTSSEVVTKEEKSYAQAVTSYIQYLLNINGNSESTKNIDIDSPHDSNVPVSVLPDDEPDAVSPDNAYEDLLKAIESKDQVGDVPSNLPGGVLLDQFYVIAPSNLNALLFSPHANFMKSLEEMQGTTDVQEGPWKLENGSKILRRVVTYTKAATRLVKAVKATEEQEYLKADGKSFAVLESVSTPDVPYGSCFKTELLFCIIPGPELPSGDQSSRLLISWRMNFLQSTMMKGMIESGARQGLKDSYEQFAKLLSQTVEVVDLKEVGSEKEQILASLQLEQQSDWKLAARFLGNFTVFSAIFMVLYVLAHIVLAVPSTIQGLEFAGLDLPDSICEVVVGGILALQVERALDMISRFMQARMQKDSDHGIRAQGDGWLLTIALIEGRNLAAVDDTGFSDPYVVFTCNGKSRTSSIKFQKLDPQWNEIFEFDAMDEPPSMMFLEVFDFDGPFDEAKSLGHAEINFVKSNLSELADIWIPLQGKLAQACNSTLRLRIFLNNTRGTDVVNEFLTKMEKEVGKKINKRSPQTNSAFQKLFVLPPEEFLINDFTCHLKRRMPLQGRLFLSPRIIGFHANLFGHKTKFFFLWEDIEDIQVIPPTLSSVGSPSLIIILRKGRGIDARHGAKTQDEEGRLRFHFQSFVSYNVAHRTIMALWKAKSLTPEQKVQIVDEESEEKNNQTEGRFLGPQDVKMSEVYSSSLPVPTNFVMELFGGGYLDQKVMQKVGCLDYSYSPWELVKSGGVHERQICYKFDKHVSRFGGEVTSTQQRTPLSDNSGWLVDEVMELHGVPLGDYFSLHLKYQIEDLPSALKPCNVKVLIGIEWLKSTRHQKRITDNVVSNLVDRLKEIFQLVEKEFVQEK